MDENAITNYIATLIIRAESKSFKDIVLTCDNTLNGQKHFYTKGSSYDYNSKDNFSPELFMASNMKQLCASTNSVIVMNKLGNTPLQVFYYHENVSYRLIHNGKFDQDEKNAATHLYLAMCKTEDKRPYCGFNVSAYYCLYKENIDLRMDNDLEHEENVCRFYIEYGYWNSLFFKSVKGLDYIASYPRLIVDIGLEEEKALKHYFTTGMNENNAISFNPWVYVASNIHTLKGFINKKSINPEMVAKHYILHGYLQGLETNTFDHFAYLANNPHRIRKILEVDGKPEWDFNKLVPSIVAEDYIKFYLNARKRMFIPSEFVKRYILDTNVNYDGKLTIQNSHKYFVRAYVNFKYVRKSLTSINMLKSFLKRKMFGSVKQSPFNLSYIIVAQYF